MGSCVVRVNRRDLGRVKPCASRASVGLYADLGEEVNVGGVKEMIKYKYEANY